MARIRLKVDFVSTINGLTDNKSKRVAYKKVMSNPDAQRDFGNRLIDTLIERTLNGDDKNGKAFKKYSQAYKKSLAFKIYDKDPSTVTLKLTGAMQAAIRITDTNSRSVEIGIVDSVEAAKAEGHITGANHLPVRDFWGFNDKDKEVEKALKETLKAFSDVQDFGVESEAISQLGLITESNSGTNIDLTFEG